MPNIPILLTYAPCCQALRADLSFKWREAGVVKRNCNIVCFRNFIHKVSLGDQMDSGGANFESFTLANR